MQGYFSLQCCSTGLPAMSMMKAVCTCDDLVSHTCKHAASCLEAGLLQCITKARADKACMCQSALGKHDALTYNDRFWSRRSMPLTAAGGANAVNHQDEGPEGEEGMDAEPAVKKPKGAEKGKAALAKKKSSLRRWVLPRPF